MQAQHKFYFAFLRESIRSQYVHFLQQPFLSAIYKSIWREMYKLLYP